MHGMEIRLASPRGQWRIRTELGLRRPSHYFARHIFPFERHPETRNSAAKTGWIVEPMAWYGMAVNLSPNDCLL